MFHSSLGSRAQSHASFCVVLQQNNDRRVPFRHHRHQRDCSVASNTFFCRRSWLPQKPQLINFPRTLRVALSKICCETISCLCGPSMGSTFSISVTMKTCGPFKSSIFSRTAALTHPCTPWPHQRRLDVGAGQKHRLVHHCLLLFLLPFPVSLQQVCHQNLEAFTVHTSSGSCVRPSPATRLLCAVKASARPPTDEYHFAISCGPE